MAMQITSDAKQKIQLFLLAAIILAAARSGYFPYERHADIVRETQKQAAPPLNPDYYVTPKKLYPYDLKSAQQLTQQPVWVKEGYRYTFYPYSPSRHHPDFSHEAGQLLPIQQLRIQAVVLDASPQPGQREVMAVFTNDNNNFAVPIGSLREGTYQIYSDEMFYIQDPHELYKHWPADVWRAIEKHEVKPGMNELQADFAIGMGIPQPQSDSATRPHSHKNELTKLSGWCPSLLDDAPLRSRVRHEQKRRSLHDHRSRLRNQLTRSADRASLYPVTTGV
jgi:hypothetical protein